MHRQSPAGAEELAMSAGLQELRDGQLDEALERVLLPQLTEVISQREPGHCLRVTDLSAGLATRLCRRLRSASATPHCYVLAPAATGAALSADVAVTSTKLIELRNPDASGAMRPVLVVFIPPASKASAEDSFGVATFEDIAVTDVYDLLVTRLTQEVPAGLHAMIAGELFAALDETAWPYADTLARARYLLTVKHNDFDAQAAGAAVFELGLVPDFDLFRHPGQADARARANIDAMRTLTFLPRSERQRVLELGLTDTGLQRRLAEFAADAGLDDPRSWTRRIVIDSTNWRLGFHEWALAQPTVARELRIDVLDIDLPVAEPGTAEGEGSPLGRLIGQQYLAAGPKGRDKLTTRFRIDPDARRVPGLAKFSVQIHSEDAGGTGVGASVKAGRTGKTEFTATISRITRSSWDEGWHFVRVVPRDADGQPILISGHSTASSAESDRFYVVTGDRESAEPPERAAGNAAGLIQAWRSVQFAVLADGGDADAVTLRGLVRRPAGRGRAGMVRAGFTGSHLVDIVLPEPWERIETAIIAEPGTLYRWGLALTPPGLGEAVREAISWPASADRHELASFVAARAGVLSAVAQTSEHAIELVDVRDFREAIRVYAGTYKDLLARQLRRAETSDGAERGAALRGLADLLRLDTVHVDISDYRGGRREALLIAPTHPLRLLWLLTWAEAAGVWLRWSSGSSAEEVRATRNTLLEVLTAQGFPFALPHADGRLLIASDDLTPYWGIALPSETSDPHGLVSDLRAALKLGGAPGTEPDLAARLADRMERYLRLHPYVDTLVINAVNAGRADLLADSLRLVHRRPGFEALRFDVRLIVEDPEAPGIGDRLTELIAPGGDSGSAGDGLAAPVTDHLRPRLAVAVQSIDEFRDDPGGRAAHLTLLIDAFTAERVDAALPVLSAADGAARGRGIAPVHGLVQKTVTRYPEDADTIAWHRQPRHGASYPLPGAEELSDLLAELPAVISQAAAALATGDPATTRIPTVTLDLNTADRVLLYQAHRVSDWVITIDRTLSLEYFDHGGGADRPDYVIDHDTDQVTAAGRRIVVSSRSADELRALLAPVLDQHGLRLDARHAGTFFDQMRFLSGRLAFKLASTARTQRTEVLGLSLARLYLDYQGVLREQILVPLDAHQDLYREPRARRTAASRVDQQRTDLALFDLDAQARRITCQLVEVKCYTTLGEISDYERLKERITAQLDASADLIGHHFDPRRLGVDRPDRTVKNLELSALLGHYLERAIRHRVMDADAASEANWLLEHLDAGYRLDFTRTGLVFDLARAGTDAETDGGIESTGSAVTSSRNSLTPCRPGPPQNQQPHPRPTAM